MQYNNKIILLVDPQKSEYSQRLSVFLSDCNLIVKNDHRESFEFFINNYFDISLILLLHTNAFPCNDFLRYVKFINSSIPVLVITDHSSEEFVTSIFRLGANDYFKKSQHLNELKPIISNLLSPKITDRIEQRCTINSIFKAIDYINKNFYKNIRLHMVAKEAGMSVSNFERTFKQVTGSNFSAYINKMRIAKSVDMLKRTNYSICDIAVACGYVNQSHFNRIFKKIMKITPKKLKNLR